MIIWLTGLLRRRPGRVLGLTLGVAAVVALLASIGGFVAAARSTMTARASRSVAVDWQVQLTPGANRTAAARAIATTTGVQEVLPVDYGQAASLSARTGGAVQRTGAAVVVGLPATYRSTYPGQIRLLAGTFDGPVLAQQTAANLHAVPGDRIQVDIAGAPQTVQVTGVVELPQADSFFQTVGAPPGAQPTAPPDNVLLLPAAQQAALFAGHDQLVAHQLHIGVALSLAPDPQTAYLQVTRAANNLVVRLAGDGVIGDDLAAALDAARSDAAYADVLFLFLGVPGAALAALLTLGVSGASADQRRREQALVRLRGGSRAVLVRLAVAEAVLGGVAGIIVGLASAVTISFAVLGTPPAALLSSSAVTAAVGSAAAGLLLALAAVLIPTLQDARTTTVRGGRAATARTGHPWWRRVPVDAVLLTIGALDVVLTTRDTYAVVLAPEGVATVSVDYWAFVGPACLWIGGGLALLRVADLLLRRPRSVALLVRPFARPIRPVLGGFIRRRHGRVALASVTAALAFAFAITVAVFGTTYQQQAEVDARLTNGADVRVDVPPGSDSAAVGRSVSRTASVAAIEPLQHRFAYVGADLQDLYGVRATSIGGATSLQDAYFAGGTAQQVLARLRANPDGVLVSQETALDYGLRLGDRITLRLTAPGSAAPKSVRFRYVGQVLEFPTAPRDSFLVANSAYLTATSGDSAVGTYLVDTVAAPGQVAAHLRRSLGSTATITPIGVVRTSIGSSLTSVDLAGLTRLELLFALLLGVVATAVRIVLDTRERRVTFAVLTVLGASRRQLRRIVIAEGAVGIGLALLLGSLLGGLISAVLVAVLHGVFDPPPTAPAVPWPTVAGFAALFVVATGAAIRLLGRPAARPAVEILRDR